MMLIQYGTMIQSIYPESSPNYLDDNHVLWRYVPLRTLLFHLTGNIFIPSIALLQKTDPFEGTFHFSTELFNTILDDIAPERRETVERWWHDELCSNAEREAIQRNKDYPNYAAKIFQEHHFRFLRKTRFAWCWFLSQSESALMWNSYGNQGVAIATTIGHLRTMLGHTNKGFLFGSMKYIPVSNGNVRFANLPTDIKSANLLTRPFFLKREEYSSENEVRFVTAGPELSANSGMVLENIEASEWITKIRLWPGLKSVEEYSLCQVVEKLAPSISCSCSTLFGAEYRSPESFLSSMGGKFEEIFEGMWEDGSDGVPKELKIL